MSINLNKATERLRKSIEDVGASIDRTFLEMNSTFVEMDKVFDEIDTEFADMFKEYEINGASFKGTCNGVNINIKRGAGEGLSIQIDNEGNVVVNGKPYVEGGINLNKEPEPRKWEDVKRADPKENPLTEEVESWWKRLLNDFFGPVR